MVTQENLAALLGEVKKVLSSEGRSVALQTVNKVLRSDGMTPVEQKLLDSMQRGLGAA